MPANYVLLGKVTLTATTSFITISNIPQSGYTDLKLVASVRALRTGFPADDLVIQFNGVTTGYAGRRLFLNGTSVSTDVQTDIRGFASDADQTANVFGSNEFYIHDYLSSSFKSVSIDMVTENNATNAPMGIFNGLWSNTAAIHTIKVFCNNSNMVANSTFYLYGLAAVGTTPELVPFATGGDLISNDGTYWIHTFLSSGTFTPQTTLTCDYLVVAGGGGGSRGGGGAGGLRSTVTASGGTPGTVETALSLSAEPYTVIIGSGGAGAELASDGTNSVFATITSIAGGGGGSTANGRSGGSGGGGAGVTANSLGSEFLGGAGTTNQGFAGARGGGTTSAAVGGGGGGAGAAGANLNYNDVNSSNGGAGRAVAISGSSVTYAGGGGGASNVGTDGSGGAGGGGAGVNIGTTSIAGSANTGGGGGGAGSSIGGNGGSGIVIVRYPIA